MTQQQPLIIEKKRRRGGKPTIFTTSPSPSPLPWRRWGGEKREQAGPPHSGVLCPYSELQQKKEKKKKRGRGSARHQRCKRPDREKRKGGGGEKKKKKKESFLYYHFLGWRGGEGEPGSSFPVLVYHRSAKERGGEKKKGGGQPYWAKKEKALELYRAPYECWEKEKREKREGVRRTLPFAWTQLYLFPGREERKKGGSAFVHSRGSTAWVQELLLTAEGRGGKRKGGGKLPIRSIHLYHGERGKKKKRGQLPFHLFRAMVRGEKKKEAHKYGPAARGAARHVMSTWRSGRGEKEKFVLIDNRRALYCEPDRCSARRTDCRTATNS